MGGVTKAMSTIEFTRPLFLTLLLLLIPWLFWGFARSLTDLPLRQRQWSLAVRTLMMVLLVFAVSGLVWMTATDERFMIVAVDESESITPAGKEFAADWLAKAREQMGDDSLLVLPFAGTVAKMHRDVSENPGSSADSADSFSGSERLATDLALAIRDANAAIPPDYVPEIVVITDGNQTRGDVRAAVSAGSVPVSTVPVPNLDRQEAQVAAVHVPPTVRDGESFAVEVVLDATVAQQATIEVFRDDLRVESQVVDLEAGENRFQLPQTIRDQRRVRYSVRIVPSSDTLLDNNEAQALVTATGKPRVLLVDRDLQSSDTLRWALDEQGIQVDIRPPQGVPESLDLFQNFDAVVLSNVPATDLSLRQMQTIRAYVQDLGGGLVVIGGDQSFGLGGYFRSPLEDTLPVRSDFEKEKEKPSLAMVLIVDRSGSMGGTKLELAKDAARGAVELLGPRDQIGVVAFDIETYWVSRLHSAADKDYVIKRISTLATGGGTNMYPAMVEALRTLQTAVAKLKHVIILTDGLSSPGDFTGVTADMVADRITVSTVAIGDGAHGKLLDEIASLGNGRFYQCDDPQSVPQIFAKETMTASRSAINELPFFPQQVRHSRLFDGIAVEELPPLLGFVATRPKPTSEVLLTTEDGEPLLATWRYGLGKTAAFTSDAKDRWAAEWIASPDFPLFWAQLVRSVMRPQLSQTGELSLEIDEAKVRVTLDAVDAMGRFLNQADPQLSLLSPNANASQNTVMRQIAPGQYSQELPLDGEGMYVVDVQQKRGDELVYQESRGFHLGYPAELRIKPVNEELLREVADATGGLFGATPEQILLRSRDPALRPLPLWPYLLSLTLVFLLVDIALRRIDWADFRRNSSLTSDVNESVGPKSVKTTVSQLS